MAKTAPKPEEAPAAEEAAPVAVKGAKKKKMMIIAVIATVVLAIAGGSAALLLGNKNSHKKEVKKAEKSAPAVFLTLENFVVNLQSSAGEKYLQTGITLQVRTEEQQSYYKANMPQLRSRLLLLLSNKSADDLLTSEGKLKLTEEIIKQAQLPYNNDEPTPKEAEERRILGVYFSSFMIQ